MQGVILLRIAIPGSSRAVAMRPPNRSSGSGSSRQCYQVEIAWDRMTSSVGIGSGVATATKRMADAAQPARILETRKTVPGLRLLDKWSVLIGGGENHRMGLFDMLLIKDNHVAAAGGITPAVTRACKYLAERNLALPIEVETRTMDEVREVVQVMDAMGDDERSRIVRVMLDNMSLEQMTEAVDIIGGRCDTEASGNVTMETVNAIGQTGVTYISSGALTHSVIALDISMNIE